jgi:hypothetical protein
MMQRKLRFVRLRFATAVSRTIIGPDHTMHNISVWPGLTNPWSRPTDLCNLPGGHIIRAKLAKNVIRVVVRFITSVIMMTSSRVP